MDMVLPLRKVISLISVIYVKKQKKQLIIFVSLDMELHGHNPLFRNRFMQSVGYIEKQKKQLIILMSLYIEN